MSGYVIESHFSYCDEDGCEESIEVIPIIFLSKESAEKHLESIGAFNMGDSSHYGFKREIKEFEIIE